MSAVTFATEGYVRMLATLLNQAGWYAHLYTNDPVVSKDRVRADFTELVAGGYAPRPLDRWTPPALRGGVAFSLVDPLIWQIAPDPVPPAVRGYYVTDGIAGPVLWMWRRPGAAWQSVPGSTTLIVYVKTTFPPPAG